MKKIVSLMLALVMLLSLFACGNNADNNSQAPQNSQGGTAPDGEENFEPLTYDDETIYMASFQEFYDLYQEALAITDNQSERVAKMAVAEAKLLESGVLFPLNSHGGNYTMGRLAVRSAPTVAWGNDEYRYHNAIVTNELIKAEDRSAMAAHWAEVAGDGTYEQWAKDYLTSNGYTLKDTFTRIYTSDPNTWDVLNSYYQSDSEPLVNTYDGLMEYDMENELQFALAESYETSETTMEVIVYDDETGEPKLDENGDFVMEEKTFPTYVFKIRPGQIFTDSQGREVGKITAQSFVDGLQHLLDAKGGLEELLSGVIVGAEEYILGTTTDFSTVGVKAVDEYTLEYTLTSPRSYFLTMMAYNIFAPLCTEYYTSLGGKFGAEYTPDYEYGTAFDKIAYCGPYLITNATEKNTIVFEANPSYWNKDNINLKKITWLFFDSSEETRRYTDTVSGVFDSCGQVAECVELAKAQTLEGDDANVFDTYFAVSSPDSTSFVGFFNLNRQGYANYNDTNACVSQQTDNDKARTHLALNNQHFRLAIAYGMDRASHNAQTVGEELKYMSLINSYVPATFVTIEEDVTLDIGTFPAGSYYGEILQAQLTADGYPIKVYDLDADDGAGSGAGFDGWYNEEESKKEMALAVEELGALGLHVTKENPIQIDVTYASNIPTYTNRANVLKQSIEKNTDGLVQVNLIPAVDGKEWQNAVYYFESGKEANFDLNDYTGWGPDFGDPSTYLDTLMPYGDGSMSKSFGVW